MRQRNLPRYIKKTSKIQKAAFGHFVSDFGQKMSNFGQTGGFWWFWHKLQPLKFQCVADILTLPRGKMLLKNNRRAMI